MALPKKGTRKINVDGFQYSWIASGNDGWIDLIICSSKGNGQKLFAQFDYHSVHINKDEIKMEQKLALTPFIVRQVIQYGLTSGWKPEKRNAELRLGYLDGKIDLSLRR